MAMAGQHGVALQLSTASECTGQVGPAAHDKTPEPEPARLRKAGQHGVAPDWRHPARWAGHAGPANQPDGHSRQVRDACTQHMPHDGWMG